LGTPRSGVPARFGLSDYASQHAAAFGFCFQHAACGSLSARLLGRLVSLLSVPAQPAVAYEDPLAMVAGLDARSDAPTRLPDSEARRAKAY